MTKLLTFLSVLCFALPALSQIVPEEFYIRRDRAPYDTLYRVMTQRNLATYPYATANEIYRAAVTQGLIVRTTAEGCLLTANQPAPLTKPTCSSSVSGPSWASAWYSRSGNVVTVAASGDAKQLKFERADGVAFVANNPDNIVIESGKYYVNGDLLGEGAYTQKWQVKDLPSAPIKITVKRNSDNATFTSSSFTPIDGASRVQLFTASGTTTPPVTSCNFTVSVNSLFTACGAQVQLVVTASGADASNLTYAWAGGQTGSTLNLTAPQVNGEATYQVTASKAGCAAKTASGTVTVMGCTGGPVVSGVYAYRGDSFSYAPLSSSTDDKFPVFENEKIKVTLALRDQSTSSQVPGMGGGVYQIYNKQHNATHTLVFNPNRYNGDDNDVVNRDGPPNRIGLGAGLTDCQYASPRPFFTNESDGALGSSYLLPNGEKPGGTDGYLGFNPNEIGDDTYNSGKLQAYGRAGNSFYTKILPPIYGQLGYYAGNQVFFEKWGSLNDRALVLNYQNTYNRTYTGRAVTKAQEVPSLYVNGFDTFKWYDGDAPYSNSGPTTVVAEHSDNNKLNVGKNGPRKFPVYLSEPMMWAGGSDGYGIALLMKDNIVGRYAYYGDGAFNPGNPSGGGSYASMGQSTQEIIDNFFVWRHRAEVVVGTYEECRAYMYANTYRPDFTPRFKFNVAGRNGWSLNSGDGEDKHTWDDPFTGAARQGWKVYFGASANAVLFSPGVIWKANLFNKIYIRYKYSGNQTQWRLKFQRNKQIGDGQLDKNPGTNRFKAEEDICYVNGSADRDEQKVLFTVIPDNQWHVAVVDLSGTSAWQGVINQISIYPHTNGNYQPGEYAIIDWINAENSDPFPSN